jgi:hypothetical protein
VVARGEDLNGTRAGGCEGVQQARVQPVLEEDVGGESRLHWLVVKGTAAAGECGALDYLEAT